MSENKFSYLGRYYMIIIRQFSVWKRRLFGDDRVYNTMATTHANIINIFTLNTFISIWDFGNSLVHKFLKYSYLKTYINLHFT
jgi:heme/copper-type cytochrome/quinol oxidase subunit 1